MAARTVVTDGVEPGKRAPAGADQTVGPARVWAGLALTLAARAYRAFLLTLVAAALVPTLWSWTSYVVESGSMTPALSVGDVVVGRPLPASDRVPNGRVMVFTDPARDRTLIHRVVERLGDGTFITAGDANEATDSTPVPRKNFIARGTICIPFVGLPVVWVQNHDVIPLLLWAVITSGALFVAAKRNPAPPRHRQPMPDDPEPTPAGSGRAVLGRTVGVVAGAGALALGLVMAPFSHADAAFSSKTANTGSVWKVAVVTPKATSNIQVYDTASASGWYQRGSVSVNIYASAAAGSSVRSITYRVNGGTAVTINSASIVFTLSTQVDNTITYFATDNQGTPEATRTAHIKLDNVAPSLTVTSQVGDMTHAQWRAACARPGSTGGLCGAIADAASGVASVQYVLTRSSDQRCYDGDKWTGAACARRTDATISSGTWAALVPDARLEVPRTWYTITIFVTDVAGNTSNLTRNFSVG